MPTREIPDALVGPGYASGATRLGARVGLIPVGSVARSEEWTLGLVVGSCVQTHLPKTCGDLREASQRYAAVSRRDSDPYPIRLIRFEPTTGV